jgi:single stranded DNA-binding protein (ssb)
MNRCQFMGRLTKDPEVKYTQTGKAVASFTIAVRRYKSEETDFINCVAWNVLAESCGNELQKGQLVAVDGRLQIRSYDAQDGNKRWVTEIIANSVARPLDSWERSETSGSSTSRGSSFGSEVLPDEDIPF